MTRFDSRYIQWSEVELFLQNLQTYDWQTQFVCTQRNELFVLQRWSIWAQIFCFDWLCLLVVSWYILNVKCPTYHEGRVETLLFSEGPAGHNTLNTLSRFNVVLAYCDHGSRPHTFTLSLFQRWRDWCFSNPNLIQKVYFKIQSISENEILSKSKFLSL